MNLYVAGDSFASLSKTQAIGNSWSELLASKLNANLVNVARPAASNFSIALQIEWIISKITLDDLIIILLTDHHRKTLVDVDIKKDKTKSLLEQHSIHKDQMPSPMVKYSLKPRLLSSTIHHEKTKSYYRDWFDIDVQETEDRLIITGVLAKLSSITDRFLVVKGGYENADHQTFCINDYQFTMTTSKSMLDWSDNTDSINHLDDMTHQKIAGKLKFLIKRFNKLDKRNNEEALSLQEEEEVE